MSKRGLILIVLAVTVSTLAMSTSAFAGANAGVAKVAVHVIPHASRTCAKNFPTIAGCEAIITTESTSDVDAFPVFFDLVEYQGFDYGMTWPGAFSCAFTSCSDLAIGTITDPGDGVSHAWYVCQPGPVSVPGFGWIYDTGQIEIIAHPTAGGPVVGDCSTELDDVVSSFYAGIGGTAGEDPCAVQPPICVVEPTSLDFGTVTVNTFADLDFIITNIGGSELAGEVSEACANYSLTAGAGAYAIAPGETVYVTVRFEPLSEGTHDCFIETGADCDSVPVTGVGEAAPDCQVVPTDVDFGIVTVGEFSDTTITITNVGGGTLVGGVNEACAYYEILSGDGAYALANGESHYIVLRFAPTDPGTKNCSIQTGAACDNVPVTGVGDPPPDCDVSQTSLDFGTVTVGEFAEDTFTITNNGGGTLEGSVSEACDHYSITAGGGAYSLGAGQFVDVTVRFEPTISGTHPCTIETGTECANVSCTGDGEDPPVCHVTADTIDFLSIVIGGTRVRDFYVRNDGGGLLEGNVTEACDYYSIASGGGPFSLAAGEEINVIVHFTPTVVGTHTCTIDIGTELCTDVFCTGVGEPPPECELSTTSLNFGTVVVGDSADLSFTITNVGGASLQGTVSEACDHYSIVSGGGSYALANGEFVEVTVRFKPTAAGTQDCIVATGGPCDNMPCTGIGQEPTACGVSPTLLDFGTVTVGEFAEDTFTITNNGGGTLEGSVSEACDHYSITAGGGAYSLGAGQFVDVTVRFEPTISGTHPCTIETGTECANVSCTGIGEEPQVPVCDVSQTSLDFGTVTVGDFADLVFTITNIGTGTLTGSVSETCDHYTITAGGGAYSLGAGAFVDVTVRFQPTVAGTHPCTIETGTECANVSCTGDGEDAPACNVVPTLREFGTVTVGSFADLGFTIENLGGGTLEGSVSETCDHYEIISGGGAYSLGAGAFVDVMVRFQPTVAGEHNCTIETGTECANVSCTGTGEEPQVPVCDVSQTSLDFGTVTIGDFADLTFTITNIGTGTLTGSVTETCDHYSITSGGGAYSLTNGQFVEVTVRFAPTVAGTHPCTIETGTECANVSCTGDGEDAPACSVDPTTLDFGTVTVGSHAERSFTITNTGGGLLTGDVTETCDHYTFFAGGGPFSLGAGQFRDVVVRFAPTSAGTHNCTIETGTECVNVSCTGVGEAVVPPECDVSPTTLDFGTVTVGSHAERSFTITNIGGGTLTGDVSETCDHYVFFAGGGAYSLGAGEHKDVVVRFAPASAGTHNCTIETGTECANVSATGEGVVVYMPLVLTKDDGMGGGQVDPGQTFTYMLYYENPNIADVNNAVLVDMLPAELWFVSATGGGAYNAGMHEVTWMLGTIPAGGNGTVELEVQVDPATTPGSSITNIAQINSDETGPTPTEATETTPVSGGMVDVYFDIKPGSCPNSVNPKSNGVLPVAILGTAEFDVRDIDPSTVMLTREGAGGSVAPLRYAYEDVATPFMGELCDCHELEMDGFEDMTLKFDTQLVITTLGLDALRNQTVPLKIMGALFGGTEFEAEDCVRLKGGNPHDESPGGGTLRFTPFEPNGETQFEEKSISFEVPAAGHLNLDIYDVHGRVIRRLLNQQMSSGVHTLSWDGRSDAGERMPAGVYFARVRNLTESDTRKVVIVN